MPYGVIQNKLFSDIHFSKYNRERSVICLEFKSKYEMNSALFLLPYTQSRLLYIKHIFKVAII